jgi:hypothetical protein
MLTYLLGIWWLYAYILPSIIIIQHFIDMRTGNVDQMISKHAFQAWFSSSPRILDSSSSDFHQVPTSSIQMIVFGIFHTDGKFSCMSACVCEIEIKTWSIFDVLLKSSDFHQVHELSIHHLLIFIKSPRPRSRWPFLEFFILTENFLVCQRVYVKSEPKRDRFLMFCSNRLIFIKFTNPRFIIFWFSPSPQVLDSGATFWNFSYKRGFFFPCQRVYAKLTLSSDRESYRG